MNKNEKKSDDRNAIVASWSLRIIKYALFCLPGADRSISERLVIFLTASFCSTCRRVPSPSIIPERTVSLDWENRLNGALAGWSSGSFSNRAVSWRSLFCVSI